jgi:dipeptidyl aminopeptidase/acylaminoacyl peptidase
MDRRLAGVLLLGLAALPRLLAQAHAQNQAQAPSPADKLVFEIPGDQWFEGALQRVTISPDGTYALIQRGAGAPGHRDVRLVSLKTGKDDHFTLIYDLNRIDNAVFYGRSNLARLGERASEHGWFITSGESEQLSSLPVDAVPAFGTSSREIAYYRTEAPSQAVFVSSGDQFRDFGVSGRILSMAFSPDGNYFYDLLLEPNGESYLDRINVNTGESRVLARHLDAAPQPGRIALSADGRKIYLALAGDSAPNNEERHEPQADDRWLKIYELDLASGAKRALVSSPGADNSAPVLIGNFLYWIRTVFNQSVVVLPATGGKAKEIVSEGMVPMWSPDSHRIGFSFGSPRLADWGLNLDDAVVALDDQANVASQPAVIVSGYHEDFPPAWSPDGAWIAFHSHRSPRAVPLFDDAASTDDIYLRHADDIHAPEIRLTDFGLDTGPAYWSPDGKRLLFTSQDRNGQPGVDKLYILTLDLELGRALKAQIVPLPAAIHSVDWATWSPDGESIAVEDGHGDDDRSLWTVHTDGSHAEKLVDYKCSTFCGVDWASDGKTIVYSAMAGGHAQIFAIPYFGGATRQLTQDSANLFHPQISPDGKWIACTRVVESKQIWRRPLQ